LSSEPGERQREGRSRRTAVRGGWAFLLTAYAFAVAMCGTTLPTPLYDLYQRELGFSSLLVTVIFAVYAVGVIATLLLFGRLSDHVGRRPVLLVGLALSAASALCFLLEGGIPALFAGRVLSGFSAGLFTGTATVAVIELAPQQRRGTATLVATVANMGGLGLGPLLAGVLAEYAAAPLRLVFVVDLALVGLAMVAVLLTEETVRTHRGGWPRPGRLQVPPGTRAAFVPAAMSGFAGFAMFGLFTSVAPSFLREVQGLSNLAAEGAVVFSVFVASTGGQLLMARVGVRRSLLAGCVVLFAGMVAIAASLALASLPLLVLGAVVAGAGQGLSFRAGVTDVGRSSPPDQRGEITSALFVVLYVAISLPVVGVGALAVAADLRTAGLVLACCVALLAAATAARLRLRPAPEAASWD
jgi:MFS family permease